MKKMFKSVSLTLILGLGFELASAKEAFSSLALPAHLSLETPNASTFVPDLSLETIQSQFGKTDADYGWSILSYADLKYYGKDYAALVLDKVNNRSLFVIIPDANPRDYQTSEEGHKVLTDWANEKWSILPKRLCEILTQALVSHHLETHGHTDANLEHPEFYSIISEKRRGYIVPDTFINGWIRYLDFRLCPDENVDDALLPLTNELSEYVADSLMSLQGVQCSERIFKAFEQFLQERGSVSEASAAGQPLESLDTIFEQVGTLLKDFGVEPENIDQLMEILSMSRLGGKIILASTEYDLVYKNWREEALWNQMSREVIMLGGGCYRQITNGDEISRHIFAALPQNRLGEALVVLMHELGHAYDDLKNSRTPDQDEDRISLSPKTHEENWSLFFELATVRTDPNIFNDYITSPIFLSRSLQYPLFVLLEHIIRKDPALEGFLNITVKDLLDARGNYNAWTDTVLDVLRKDERTKSVVELIEKDPNLLKKSTSCFATFFDGLIGKNGFLTKDFSIYSEGFMNAFCVLTHGRGTIVERLRLLNKRGTPIVDIDPNALQKTENPARS